MPEQVHCAKCGSENVIFSKKRSICVCEDCGHEFTPAKTVVPFRIFLSYGHDEHSSLARRLRDDLHARGHQVWFDEERLSPGHDWEGRIEKGLEWLAADKAHSTLVLLLTPYSVRRPDGYCLNEVARALSRGLRILPLMVVESEPPLSICRLQWLDMRECIPIHEKEAFYRPRFERLLKAIEENLLDFEGVQQRLIKALQPLEFDAEILLQVQKFTGRQWVLDSIQEWLRPPATEAPPKPRVFWISGGPGVGKTALSAVLSSRYLEVAALHLCKFGHAQKSDPRRVVTSLAYQLSTQLPEYEARLTGMDVERLAQDDARTMFDNLLVQPLAKLSQPNRPIIILIDALDEATRDGRNELASFIAAEFSKTPQWLRLLITGRPEKAVTVPLQGLNPFVLDTETEANRADIRDYLRCELSPLLQNRPDADRLVGQILEKSEGVFLYVARVCDDLQHGHLSLERVSQFPQGLGGVFWQFFDRQFPDLERFRKEVRSALRTILAAREPLPMEILQRLFNWQDEELRDFTRTLGSLFPVTTQACRDVIKPYHKSLADWLADEAKAGPYFASVKEGHRALAAACWTEYQRGIPTLSPYSLAHLPAHLIVAERWDDLEMLLTDIFFLEAKNKAGMVFTLAGELSAAVTALPEDRPQLRILKLLNEALRRDIHFIARHAKDYPQALYQCLWNTCWWYGCSTPASHYRSAAWDNEDKQEQIEGPGHCLSTLLENHRRCGIAATPAVAWLRSLRPPEVPLGTAQRAVFRGHADRVTSVAYAPDGRCCASASRDRTIRVWDAVTGRQIHCLEGHGHWVAAVAFSSDGQRIVSGCHDGTIRIWDLNTGRELMCIRGHADRVAAVAYSHRREQIVSGSWDRSVRLWDAASGSEIRSFWGHEEAVQAVAWSSDDQYIASGATDDTVRVWDWMSGQQLHCLKGHDNTVLSVAFSPDGRCLASAARDRAVRLWDTASGEEMGVLLGHGDMIYSVAFSHDGHRLASGSWDKTLRIWDVEAGVECARLFGHEGRVTAVAYSPDGQYIISGGTDHTVRVWTAEGGSDMPELRGHSARITSLAFSPDGRWLLSGSLDRTAILWDAEKGIEVRCLREHKGEVYSVAFCSDDRRCVTRSADRVSYVWDVETGACLDAVEDLARLPPLAGPPMSTQRKLLPLGVDTVVVDAESGREIAWFPVRLSAITPHPTRPMWAGAVGKHAYVLALETTER